MTIGSRRRTFAAIGMIVVALSVWMIAERRASSAVESKLDGVWQIVEIDHVQPMYSRDFTVTDYWEFQKDGPTSIHFALGSPMTSSRETWSASRGFTNRWLSGTASATNAIVSVDLNLPVKPGVLGVMESLKRSVGVGENVVAMYQLQWHSDDECSLESTSGYSFAFRHQHVRLKRSDRPHTPE